MFNLDPATNPNIAPIFSGQTEYCKIEFNGPALVPLSTIFYTVQQGDKTINGHFFFLAGYQDIFVNSQPMMTVDVQFNVLSTPCEEMYISVQQQSYSQTSAGEPYMQHVFSGQTTNCGLHFEQTTQNGNSFFYYTATRTDLTMNGAFNYVGGAMVVNIDTTHPTENKLVVTS